MEKLKGKTILLGREAGQSRLLVAVDGKAAAVGAPGSVPASVSRCRPAEGAAHAQIRIGADGNMTLVNMNPQNVTAVNGSEIMSKRVKAADAVALGAGRYGVNLSTVLEVARQLVPAAASAEPGAFDISPLRRVWDDYHDRCLAIKERQRKQGIYASLPMFFTMGGAAVSFVLSFILGEQYKNEIQIFSGILVVAGLFMLMFSFMKRKNDSSIRDLEQATEDFQDRYVCPNPECNRFLGNMSYKLLRKQYPKCPYCGSRFIEQSKR